MLQMQVEMSGPNRVALLLHREAVLQKKLVGTVFSQIFTLTGFELWMWEYVTGFVRNNRKWIAVSKTIPYKIVHF